MIGIALTKFLIQKDIHVTSIIREGSTNRDVLPQSPLIKIVECDLDNTRSLKLDGGPYDCLYHLAWAATDKQGRQDPASQLRNVETTIDVVELCKRENCACFVGAGSQAEYGRVEGKISPTHPPAPENAYGVTKNTAGQLSRILCNKYGIRHIWPRIFSVYGPHQDVTMIGYAIKNMTANQECNFSGAEQIWDYLHCDDCANALYLIGTKGKDNAIYNIGSGKAEPLKNYIETIRKVTKTKSKVNYGAIPYAPKEVMHLCADIGTLTKDTGFVPKVSFPAGIKLLLDEKGPAIKTPIFIDLDGTLLNDDKEISPENMAALAKAKAAGYEPVICTGRPVLRAEFFIPALLGIGCKYLIYSNGAGLLDFSTGKILVENVMPFDDIMTVVKAAQTHENINIMFSSGIHRYHVTRKFSDKGFTASPKNKYLDEPVQDFVAKHVIVDVTIPSPDNTILNKIIATIGNKANLTEHSKSGDLHIIKYGTKNTSKGDTIKVFCQKFGIPIGNTTCMGDDWNDMTMFQTCGYKVAMGNAIDEIKAKADFTTKTNNENGVAYAIEKMLAAKR